MGCKGAFKMTAEEFIKQYGWSNSSVIVFESIGHGANT